MLDKTGLCLVLIIFIFRFKELNIFIFWCRWKLEKNFEERVKKVYVSTLYNSAGLSKIDLEDI